ncbi:MAG: 50S ribosomal protein L3 [Nitrospirae bacterium]|nr:50S ribosomal protein L3 [Nitrospirota bacterium]
MREGILGRKIGMTQIFMEDGRMVPVTVVEAGPCSVVQVKNRERDGYVAAQIAFGAYKNDNKVNKPMAGHFKSAGVKPGKHLVEIPAGEFKVGDEINATIFEAGKLVAVTGKSIGKGFQGVMKRHNFSGGPDTHGSMFNRAPGSIGQCSQPSRVFKNLGMPGRMGGERVTVRKVEVVGVKAEQNLILLKGGVPGPKGGILFIGKDDK